MVTIKNMKYIKTLRVIQVSGKCPSKESRGSSLYSTKIRHSATREFERPIKTDVGVEIDFFYKGVKTRPDIDNAEKLVLDSLKGVAFLDDKQVIDSRKKVHDTTVVMEFFNEPIFLANLLMEGSLEYTVIRIHEK